MIKNIKTYPIFTEIQSDGFITEFYLDFQPDEVIVKKIDYISTNLPDNRFFLIYSNLVNDYLGYSRSSLNNVSNELQTRFKLSSPIRGEYNFSFRNINNEITAYEGELIIFLEFIEYVK